MIAETSCKDKILAKQAKLTQTEQKIADYVLSNGEEILHDTITEFAEKVGVSDASVVRFCRHVGYKGYQDFKIHAARDVLPRDRQFNPVLREGDDATAITNKIFNSEMSVLSRTLLGIDVGALKEIAIKIRQAGKVAFFGTGGSLNVAKDALHKFMKVGIMIYVYDDMDLQHMASSLLGENDVAVCISHSGSNINVMKCMETAKSNGAYTVAMTGYSRNHLAKAADQSIQIASEPTMYQSETVSTRIAQLAVIDTLVAMAAFENYEDSYEAIQATRRATSDNKI